MANLKRKIRWTTCVPNLFRVTAQDKDVRKSIWGSKPKRRKMTVGWKLQLIKNFNANIVGIQKSCEGEERLKSSFLKVPEMNFIKLNFKNWLLKSGILKQLIFINWVSRN